MDPVSLILAALAAGAAAGGKDVATSAIKDGYAGLKRLLIGRFRRSTPEVAATQEIVLAEHETDPDTYDKPLAKAVSESGADRDEEILAAATALLEQADPDGMVRAKYHVNISSSRDFIVGDHGRITHT